MFDLEREIERWKSGFTASEAMRKADVEELEQHVRDALPPLKAAGLTPEEAFLVATRRVGTAAAVTREFGKVNGARVWSQRVFWLAAGALGYVACRLVIGASASLGQAVVGHASGSLAAAVQAGVVVTGAGWLLVALALYGLCHRRADAELPRLRAATLALGVAVVLALAASMNVAGEVMLAQLVPLSDSVREVAIATFASRIATVLVPLVLFTAVLLRARPRGVLE
jgi:hypothetical protein